LFPWEIDRAGPIGHARIRVGKSVMDVPSDMAWSFFEDGTYYEKNVTYWIETLFERLRGRVFYDVGANYGFFSLLLAHRAKRVHAFEPVASTRRFLRKNIRANKLENIDVHAVGLSDQRGKAEIHIYECSGKNSLYPRGNERSRLLGTEVITLTPLDQLIQRAKLAPPDLIKIDIEGGELAALKGARSVLARHRPALVIEYLDHQFKDAGYRRGDLLDELTRAEYTVYGIPEDVSDLKAYPIARARDIEVASIIALPPGKTQVISRSSVRRAVRRRVRA
jgi:FkbM family methyltransferase